MSRFQLTRTEVRVFFPERLPAPKPGAAAPPKGPIANAPRGRSGYRWVTPYKHTGRWAAIVRGVWLGTFDTQEEAARAAARKALELYGPGVPLNFPEGS